MNTKNQGYIMALVGSIFCFIMHLATFLVGKAEQRIYDIGTDFCCNRYEMSSKDLIQIPAFIVVLKSEVTMIIDRRL